jgi:hypothetical protein
MFVIISPFKEDLALYLNNLEFPLPKDNLYQVWLKLVLVLENKIFKNFHCIFIRYYVPLGILFIVFHLNNLESRASP